MATNKAILEREMCPLNTPCGFHLNVPTKALGFLSVKYFS